MSHNLLSYRLCFFSCNGYQFWADEIERRRRNGLPTKRKRQDRLPAYFYTVRIINPPDVAANETPVFSEEQSQWQGTRVLREHVLSDAHSQSELRKWWFTRSSKYYRHHPIDNIEHPYGTYTIEYIFTWDIHIERKSLSIL